MVAYFPSSVHSALTELDAIVVLNYELDAVEIMINIGGFFGKRRGLQNTSPWCGRSPQKEYAGLPTHILLPSGGPFQFIL